MFNNHFSTVGSKIEKKIPLAQGDFKEYFNKKDDNGNLIINPMYSFFLPPLFLVRSRSGLMPWTQQNLLVRIVYQYLYLRY